MTIIDSHHHFWRFTEEEYGWIDPKQTALRRDYFPAHLQAEIAGAGVEGVISVQARQTLQETEWLLALAKEHTFIKAVVGWVPLISANLDVILAPLAAQSKLRSVRHVLQGEPSSYMAREDFNRGLTRVGMYGLAYDLLVFAHQLPEAIALVDRHPRQTFILDHIAKPKIAAGEREPWATLIRDLARRPNVYCKVSGMVTEADRDTWTESQLEPYFAVVLDAFGPKRLMFGSDWPVCLDACRYPRWVGVVRGWIDSLSADEQARILGGTAIEAYRLS